MHYDFIIVGAGFAGSVMAERIATQLNKRVLIVEKEIISAVMLMMNMMDMEYQFTDMDRIFFTQTVEWYLIIYLNLLSGDFMNIKFWQIKW